MLDNKKFNVDITDDNKLYGDTWNGNSLVIVQLYIIHSKVSTISLF